MTDAKDVIFFMDIKNDGTLASNDLYIFNKANLNKMINKQELTDYLLIKDYFGEGKIEDVRAEDTSTCYELNDGALNNATNSLIQQVQAWLTNVDHSYGSVSEAIADGANLSGAAKGYLAAAYSTAINNTTFNNYWTQI